MSRVLRKCCLVLILSAITAAAIWFGWRVLSDLANRDRIIGLTGHSCLSWNGLQWTLCWRDRLPTDGVLNESGGVALVEQVASIGVTRGVVYGTGQRPATGAGASEMPRRLEWFIITPRQHSEWEPQLFYTSEQEWIDALRQHGVGDPALVPPGTKLP